MRLRHPAIRLTTLLALVALPLAAVPVISAAPPPPAAGAQIDFGKTWVAQGPTDIANGQTEGLANNEVIGAIHDVAPHPTNANILHLGSVHGGIWRTTNALAAEPTWTKTSSDTGAQAIGALEYDPTDATNNRMLAGFGYYSSFTRFGARLDGLLLSTDNGVTWAPIVDPLLTGENISGVAVRGNILVASSNSFGGNFMGNGRLVRSPDGGTTWTQISGGIGTGLPNGDFTDMVGDPTSATRLYTYVQSNGIYRSDDTGATWTGPLTNNGGTLQTEATLAACAATFFAAPPGPICQSNLEMDVSPTTGRLWICIVSGGQPNWIGYSDDADTAAAPTWTEMDLPLTGEVAGGVGLAPRAKAGAQGAVHLSIAVDPTDDDICYFGGDRQPSAFINDIGAADFSGRLFRCDASVVATGRGDPTNAADALYSTQWRHITHADPTATALPSTPNWDGGGTADTSAPHADSRDMAFDANGCLIEGDDGGIYVNTNPSSSAGRWLSLMGTNLQVTEAHDVAYDTVSDIIMSGHQDTGTAQQTATGALTYTQIPSLQNFSGTNFFKADGGDVNVDAVNPAGGSTRYQSIQNLGFWSRRQYNGAGVFLAGMEAVIGPIPGTLAGQFKTPVELNRVNPLRVIVGAGDDAYEDSAGTQGDGLVALGLGGVNRPGGIAYGAGGNAEAAYVAVGATVFTRFAVGPFAATLPGGTVRDLEMDPANAMNCAAVDSNQVFWTVNGGTLWTDITGDLVAVTTAAGGNGVLDLRTVTYVPVPGAGPDGILVGNRNGVYGTLLDNLGVWFKVGNALPDARIYELQYDATDDLLVAGTMGRGHWTTPMLTVPSDVTPPVLTCTLARTIGWPPFGGLIPVGLMVTATDNQPPDPIVTVTVYSDEADPAGPFSPDATGTMPADTRLRLQRDYPWGGPAFAGDAAGRVYLVRADAFDAAGNVTTDCKSMIVPTLPYGMLIMMLQAQAMAGEAACEAIPAMGGVATPAPTGYTQALCYQAP